MQWAHLDFQNSSYLQSSSEIIRRLNEQVRSDIGRMACREDSRNIDREY